MQKTIIISGVSVFVVALVVVLMQITDPQTSETQEATLPANSTQLPAVEVASPPETNRTIIHSDALVFLQDGDIYVARKNEIDEFEQARQITEYGYNMQVAQSPSGSGIVFLSVDSEKINNRGLGAFDDLNLWRIDLDGENAKKVFQSADDAVLASDPRWSPNGRYFAYMVTFADSTRELRVHTPDGALVQQISDSTFENFGERIQVLWGPSSQQLIVTGAVRKPDLQIGPEAPLWTHTILVSTVSGEASVIQESRTAPFLPSHWSALDNTIYGVADADGIGQFDVISTSLGQEGTDRLSLLDPGAGGIFRFANLTDEVFAVYKMNNTDQYRMEIINLESRAGITVTVPQTILSDQEQIITDAWYGPDDSYIAIMSQSQENQYLFLIDRLSMTATLFNQSPR